MSNIAFILGTRPEIIKLSPLISDCQAKGQDFFIIHTNQHYDASMDANFFKELRLPLPKYNLQVGSDTQGAQLAKMLVGIETVLVKERPKVVVVQGDTNTVMAGAIIATRYGIKLAHVEAGLRSYDRSMPEEVNRIITDSIADYLYCPTDEQRKILLAEGISSSKVLVTGNTIVDAVFRSVDLAETESTILQARGLEPNSYFLLTCHRPSNTDSPQHFEEILRGISQLASENQIVCVFPMHPRLKKYAPLVAQFKNIQVTEPVSYFDSLMLQKYAHTIFTDSGGIQEEACILEKKCVILRTTTERPETLEVGGAVLINAVTQEEIIRGYRELADRQVGWTNPFGTGRASKTILEQLEKI